MKKIRFTLSLLALACSGAWAQPPAGANFFADLNAAQQQVAAQAAANAKQREQQKMSVDVQYVRKSIEYAAACRSKYKLGLQAVRQAFSRTHGQLAVVLDLDETVLDNSQYQWDQGGKFSPATWNDWVTQKKAGTVPGADDFLKGVYLLGPRLHVVFITDRTDGQKQATLENLAANGLLRAGSNLGAGDLLLTKSGPNDPKLLRRICVMRGNSGASPDPRCSALPPMKIIALFGDSLRDFVEYYQKELVNFYGSDYTLETAKDRISKDPRWDKEWFLLPNPMYGQWLSDYK